MRTTNAFDTNQIFIYILHFHLVGFTVKRWKFLKSSRTMTTTSCVHVKHLLKSNSFYNIHNNRCSGRGSGGEGCVNVRTSATVCPDSIELYTFNSDNNIMTYETMTPSYTRDDDETTRRAYNGRVPM